jgi:hypothetical protein
LEVIELPVTSHDIESTITAAAAAATTTTTTTSTASSGIAFRGEEVLYSSSGRRRLVGNFRAHSSQVNDVLLSNIFHGLKCIPPTPITTPVSSIGRNNRNDVHIVVLFLFFFV